MTIIEMNDWNDGCYQTTHVIAHVMKTNTGETIDKFEMNFSNQFDLFDLVSHMSQLVGQKYKTCDAYVGCVGVEGIDRL